MKKLLFGAVCLSVLVSAAGLFLTGCDEAEGLELIVITPTQKEMTTRETTVWLTASFPGATKQDATDTNTTSTTTSGLGDPVAADDILHLPLEWSVANGSLGSIIGSGGTSALYVRTPNLGVNRVTVKDQYGNVGYSDIRQMVEQYRLELTAVSGTSNNTLSAAYIPVGAVTATIRVSSAIGGDGPTAPFTWSVLFPTRGYIQAGQGSDTVVFRTTTLSGYNVVQCTDAYGVVGTIVVQIGVEDDDGGGDGDDGDDGGGGGGGGTVDSSLSLDANPEQIENGDNTSTVTITSTSTPAYTWTVTPEDAGNTAFFQELDTTALSQVHVQTSGDGDYTVSVSDGVSRLGEVTISQE